MTSDALFTKELLSRGPRRGRPAPPLLFLESGVGGGVEDDGVKQVRSNFDHQVGPHTLKVTPQYFGTNISAP
jgi:hypothetical protein